MFVSLYALHMGKTEIGRYGMSLEEAKEMFLATCKKLEITPKEVGATVVNDDTESITIRLPFVEENGDLLSELANIKDCRDDAPDRYQLVYQKRVPAGEYVQTGSYYC